MMKHMSREVGRCPFCNSVDTECYDFEYDGEWVIDKYKCECCHERFEEVYDLKHRYCYYSQNNEDCYLYSYD